MHEFQSKKVGGSGGRVPLSKKVGGRRPPRSPRSTTPLETVLFVYIGCLCAWRWCAGRYSSAASAGRPRTVSHALSVTYSVPPRARSVRTIYWPVRSLMTAVPRGPPAAAASTVQPHATPTENLWRHTEPVTRFNSASQCRI